MNNDTTAAAKIIPFRKKELLLVDSGGQPFVPMKPVVEGMGLDWKSQYAKLQGGRFNSTMVMITTVAGDGKSREMSCMPLRKLAGWLMSIHASKVREDLRDNVIAYQNECDDALWAYWNNGIAIRRDDRTPANVLSTTIGTDGFHCLAAVVDGKVRHLPRQMRRGAKNHIWSQVHKAFSVVNVECIPAADMDSVRNFIAAYTREGEWLPKSEGVVLSEIEVSSLRTLVKYTEAMRSLWRENDLTRAARALQSEPMMRIGSLMHELGLPLMSLERISSGLRH